ncbi:MAG: signal recognition particle subunit SRP19/SEC65 family protein [Thermoplasmata archaeon]
MPDHIYIYPAYLRRKGSRADGRRVSAEAALPEVTVEEIVAAARGLGFTASAETGKQYPRAAHRYEGRVKVGKRPGGPSKTGLLREIARVLRSEARPSVVR